MLNRTDLLSHDDCHPSGLGHCLFFAQFKFVILRAGPSNFLLFSRDLRNASTFRKVSMLQVSCFLDQAFLEEVLLLIVRSGNFC